MLWPSSCAITSEIGCAKLARPGVFATPDAPVTGPAISPM